MTRREPRHAANSTSGSTVLKASSCRRRQSGRKTFVTRRPRCSGNRIKAIRRRDLIARRRVASSIIPFPSFDARLAHALRNEDPRGVLRRARPSFCLAHRPSPAVRVSHLEFSGSRKTRELGLELEHGIAAHSQRIDTLPAQRFFKINPSSGHFRARLTRWR